MLTRLRCTAPTIARESSLKGARLQYSARGQFRWNNPMKKRNSRRTAFCVVSEARRGKAPARARCVRALSIQRLEGSRPRLQRTRALCKLTGVQGWRGRALGSCGGAQQLTRWVAKLAMTKECCEESA